MKEEEKIGGDTIAPRYVAIFILGNLIGIVIQLVLPILPQAVKQSAK